MEAAMVAKRGLAELATVLPEQPVLQCLDLALVFPDDMSRLKNLGKLDAVAEALKDADLT